MTRRFSRLNFALRSLSRPDNEGDQVAAPSGSILRNYQEIREGSRRVNYTRDANSRQIAIDQVTILPFYTGANPDEGVIVPISRRANTAEAASNFRSAANHLDVDAENHDVISRFQPARVIVGISSGTPTERTSQITRETYLARDRDSYTIPYGGAAGETFEGAVRATIIEAANDSPNITLSFRPESR